MPRMAKHPELALNWSFRRGSSQGPSISAALRHMIETEMAGEKKPGKKTEH